MSTEIEKKDSEANLNSEATNLAIEEKIGLKIKKQRFLCGHFITLDILKLRG